jgi:hypothetical protein
MYMGEILGLETRLEALKARVDAIEAHLTPEALAKSATDRRAKAKADAKARADAKVKADADEAAAADAAKKAKS